MEKGNLFKTIAIFLLCFSAVALAGLNIYQYIQLRNSTRATSAGTSSDKESTAGLMSGNATAVLEDNKQNQTISGGKSQTGNNEVDELMYHLDAATEELEVIKEQISADEAKEAKKKELQKELMKKSLGNQANKDAFKKSIDLQYPGLFEKLNLSPEKLDEFKDLLAEQMLAQQEIFLEFDMTGDLTTEEQQEMGRRYGEIHDEYQSKIEEQLEESEYATYQWYTETQGERYRVNSFTGYLDSGETLSGNQKETLIEAMHEELKYVVYEMPDDPEASSNMSSEEEMERSLANYTRTNEAYLKAANSVLSAAQLEKFEVYLQNETEQFRLILEMQALRENNSIGIAVVVQ